jgi:hypothetical protein
MSFSAFSEWKDAWKAFSPGGAVRSVKTLLVDLLWDSDEDEEAADRLRKKPRKKETAPRRMEPVPNYSLSIWSKMLRDPALKSPGSKLARKFRRRFRVPYPLFLLLLEELKSDTDGGWDNKDATGLEGRKVPLEIKLLAALRALGRGEVFDTLAEITFVSEDTLRLFFHKWTLQ